ncbi:MAG: protease inhibitor Inh/omp19 family protein [Xanthobacteraceae bacterium]|nr:protease inhibitor Inh/omp19 family protein [Xanthobacteraceae bacterium]
MRTRAGIAALAVLLAGCGSAPNLGGSQAAAPAPAAAPADMGGRWQLSSPAGGACAVTVGPGTTEGTLAPEGGCPGNFYTSRKWTFEQGALVIRDHTGKALGQLTLVSPGRFEGQAAGGIALMLAR